MRTTLRNLGATMTVAVTVGLGALMGTGTAAAVDIPTVTDQYLFHTSLSGFESTRAQQPYNGQLDWSSDGCSWSPDTPFGWQFLPGCHRHDFGYRNYKKQGRFTSANRLKIDDNLYSDLKSVCGSNIACKGAAWTYYQAVRKFGG
jgi:hypothetical protein